MTAFCHDLEIGARLFPKSSLREGEIVQGRSYAALSGLKNDSRNAIAFSWRAGTLARRTAGEHHLALATAYTSASDILRVIRVQATSCVSNDLTMLCRKHRLFPRRRSKDALHPARLNCAYWPRSSHGHV